MSTRDDDAALLRALRGATFGPNASVTLPTGETLTGDEMALWVDGENTGSPTIPTTMVASFDQQAEAGAMTENPCGSPDLDSGIFYVRMEIDGHAVLSTCSLCAECQAMVPTKAIDDHSDWHIFIDRQIRGW